MSLQSTKTQSNFYLSEQDVAQLLTEATADSRITVLEKIAVHYHEGQFDQREMAIAEQIFRVLLRDTEQRVRETLAENIKENPHIPRDIVLSLVRDVNEVSLPIIRVSEVLNDSDLLDIIRNSEEIERHVAIAQRPTVSAKVSDALIETNHPEVVSELMKNPGAQISEGGYQNVMRDFAAHENIMAAMSNRSALPVTVVEKLITLVSGAISDQLARKYKISPTEIALETEQTREQATLSMLDATPHTNDTDTEKLVTQLFGYGRLTPSMIITGLARGNFRFFEMSLAKLAHIPIINARQLINDKGDLGFKALYGKAGLPESMFDAVRLLLRVTQQMVAGGEKPGTLHYSNRMVEQLLMNADGQEIENLSYIIALLRQNIRH